MLLVNMSIVRLELAKVCCGKSQRSKCVAFPSNIMPTTESWYQSYNLSSQLSTHYNYTFQFKGKAFNQQQHGIYAQAVKESSSPAVWSIVYIYMEHILSYNHMQFLPTEILNFTSELQLHVFCPALWEICCQMFAHHGSQFVSQSLEAVPLHLVQMLYKSLPQQV